jgi:hypothetical protein
MKVTKDIGTQSGNAITNIISGSKLVCIRGEDMKIILCIFIFGIVNGANLQAQTFMGYPCTEDCSGHKAGYEWAEENDIDDSFDCSGNSDSFNEGCESYVEEQEEEEEEEDDYEDEEDEDLWD